MIILQNCSSTGGEVEVPQNFKKYISDIDGDNTWKYTLASDELSGISQIKQYQFKNVKNLTEISIPANVSRIRTQAFEDCTGLTRVTMANGLNTIEDYAFRNCINLSYLRVSDTVNSIMSNAFDGCPSSIYYTTPYGEECLITNSGDYRVIMNGRNSTRQTFSFAEINGSAIVMQSAFQQNAHLTSVLLAGSNKQIGHYAFNNCPNITSVNIELESNSTIGSSVFSNCAHLQSADFSLSTITYIPESMFNGCAKLNTVVLPSTITGIHQAAFTNCISLTSITLPQGLQGISSDAFSGCVHLTSLAFPSTLRSISYGVFNGSGITSFHLPALLTYLGGSYESEIALGLMGCPNLEYITVDQDNTAFYAVGNCLISNKFPGIVVLGCGNSVIPSDGSITKIGSSAFYSNSVLTSIDIPEGVTEIGSSAFRSCSNLATISLPSTLTLINYDAFSGCVSLIDINYNGTTSQWGTITKDSNWNSNTGNYTIHCKDGDIPKQ